MSHPESRTVLYSLVRDADVVLDNYRPGVMKGLGFDHEALEHLNSKIVSCSLTGFGETGPTLTGPDTTTQSRRSAAS